MSPMEPSVRAGQNTGMLFYTERERERERDSTYMHPLASILLAYF